MSPEYLLTTLVVVLAPGAGVLYTLSIGLTDGARASIAAAAGCTLGILPSLIAAVTGLAAILHTSALAFQIIKVLGVLYLLYMAWRTLRDTTPLAVETSASPRHSMMRTAAKGTLLNVLNPKLSLFFLAFLPQFVSASGPAAVIEMLMLGAVFMLVTLVIFIGYGCGAAWLRRHVVDRPSVQAWMRRSLAGVFVLLGARLAVSER
ncbi:LysE family translocator [Halomonas cupida]|uniref:Lysine transporter LysE n=1 Tax=Halomonas cupida TaxID=44933 RepID=A0A1M7CBT0_9GAMM|nr:LysE family translocator [Halomonas cupida]GEN25132.1 lysine transporter LysE [Halomonas cupida]SHL64349.1 Threonine/homoserine/homoserine lactone efflux protein [Halomonas cupida]